LSLDPATLSWEPVHIAPRWPTLLEGERVCAIEAAPDGSIWFSVEGMGLVHYSDGAIQNQYTIADGLPIRWVRDISMVSDGTLWICGGDSVASLDGRSWAHHDLRGLGELYAVAAGPDGDVWVGGRTDGILHWDGNAWERVAPPDEGMRYRIYDIEADSDGGVWCATARGAAHYDGNIWSVDLVGDGYRDSLQLASSPGGAVHLFLERDGVWKHTGDEWTRLPNLRGRYVDSEALYVTSEGRVWVGTARDGAFRFDGETWQQFTAMDGLPSNNVLAIAEDADGWLWFGTSSGAARVDPATLAQESK
jgi:ligand-binding sensor domain-containing protein